MSAAATRVGLPELACRIRFISVKDPRITKLSLHFSFILQFVFWCNEHCKEYSLCHRRGSRLFHCP